MADLTLREIFEGAAAATAGSPVFVHLSVADIDAVLELISACEHRTVYSVEQDGHTNGQCSVCREIVHHDWDIEGLAVFDADHDGALFTREALALMAEKRLSEIKVGEDAAMELQWRAALNWARNTFTVRAENAPLFTIEEDPPSC